MRILATEGRPGAASCTRRNSIKSAQPHGPPMSELDEFAEALLGQLSVEIGEEKEIASLSRRISEDAAFDARFEPLGGLSERLLPDMRERLEAFTGLEVPGGTGLELTGLADFKRLKGRKVATGGADARRFVDGLFQAVADEDRGAIASLIDSDLRRYLVYSTYAIQYVSKLTTTYGDYFGSAVHLNEFVLSSYPQIILYKQGQPYAERSGRVAAGYAGAVKMTLLEELAHSQQGPLHEANQAASVQVNAINEELAGLILDLGESAASSLYDYLQLQAVPDDFPVAKRANLFFMLNPDNFIVNVLGPDVMTYTRIEVDPRISEAIPELLGVYQRWLPHIQAHHAAFTAMEGMAEFAVESILADDADFQAYLSTFMGTDMSAYRVRKSMGRDFTRAVHEKRGREGAFAGVLGNPPTTRELKDPGLYLDRVG